MQYIVLKGGPYDGLSMKVKKDMTTFYLSYNSISHLYERTGEFDINGNPVFEWIPD